jgi:hypothetical protein
MSRCFCCPVFLLTAFAFIASAVADEPVSKPTESKPAATQAEREAALAEMLSGATLEGSFTVTGRDFAPAPEKYTLGVVRKVDPQNPDNNLWLIPTRIQYGGKDAQLPITLPIDWAGDTPVVIVDNVGLPGFGTVSARVLFYSDHYAGYWQHGESSGNLFGTIHRAKK